MRVLLSLALIALAACERDSSSGLLPEGVGPVRVAPPPQLKLVIAVSSTQSFNITDPSGQRANAVTTLLNNLPPDTGVLVAGFAGTAVGFFSPTGRPVFTRLETWSANDRSTLALRVLSFRNPGTLPDSIDFVTPLGAIRDAIIGDRAGGGSSRYEVILVSDGGPTTDQDQALLCENAVTGLTSLSAAPNDVKVNTIYVNLSQVTPCSGLVLEGACSIRPAASGCPASVVAADEARLRRMATLGGGTFRSFRAGSFVDYAAVLAH